MIKFFLGILVVFGMSGCTTTPIFQKSSGDYDGYSVQETNRKDHFRITIKVPSESSEKFRAAYGMRAVGEECLNRGFQYFDFTDLVSSAVDGFCFTSPNRRALGVTFESAGLKQTPQRFIVEDLNSKTSTLLKTNDEVITIGSESVTSMSQIKSIVFAGSDDSKNILPLKIKRQGVVSTVNEPLANLKNGNLGQSELESFRHIAR
jgi:hypothetical protein